MVIGDADIFRITEQYDDLKIKMPQTCQEFLEKKAEKEKELLKARHNTNRISVLIIGSTLEERLSLYLPNLSIISRFRHKFSF